MNPYFPLWVLIGIWGLGSISVSGQWAPQGPIQGQGKLEELDEWSIRQEVQTLERSLAQYDPLIQTLGEARVDLDRDLKALRAHPEDSRLATQMALKLSAYAREIVGDFDRVIEQQDALLNTFEGLKNKLIRFRESLRSKEARYGREIERVREKDESIEARLKDLATRYKETVDESERSSCRAEFKRVWRQFRMNQRFLEGYGRSRRGYESLSGSLDALLSVFENLEKAFVELIDNLGSEKRFLMVSIQLHQDNLKVTRLVYEGLEGGSGLAKELGSKSTRLFQQVELFGQIQERVHQGLVRFTNNQIDLVGVARKIDRVGALQSEPDVEQVIDDFYQRPVSGQEE